MRPCSTCHQKALLFTLGNGNGSFTLPDTMTDTDKMCTKPSGNFHRSWSKSNENFSHIIIIEQNSFRLGSWPSLSLGLGQCKHNTTPNKQKKMLTIERTKVRSLHTRSLLLDQCCYYGLFTLAEIESETDTDSMKCNALVSLG